MRRVATLTVIVVITIAVLVVATFPQGRPATFVDPMSANCGFGCWDEIRPGKTTMKEAEALLQQNPYITIDLSGEGTLFWAETPQMPAAGANTGSIAPKFGSNFQWDWESVVATVNVQFSGKSRFSLGDAIFLWGKPVGMYTSYCQIRSQPDVGILFKGNILVTVDRAVQVNGPDLASPGLTPESAVGNVTYYPPDVSMAIDQHPWKGFLQFAQSGIASVYCG